MEKKSCCCSTVLSCFSCFSAKNNPTSPSAGGPSTPSKVQSAPPFEPAIPAAVFKPDEAQASAGGPSTPSKVQSAPPFEPAKEDTVPTVDHHSRHNVGSSSANDKVGEGASSSARNDDAASLATVPHLTSDIVQDVEGEKVDLDGLINHISQLMDLIQAKHSSSREIQGRAQEYLPTTSKIFHKFKKFLFDAKDVIPGEAIKTAVSFALKGVGAADLVTTPFVVVATILERFEDVRDNEDECINLLNEMFDLAKLVRQFREDPQLKETQEITDVIKEANGLIVEGSIVCCTQMKASKFSKFRKASGNKEEMSKFRQKLRDMYTHMNAQMNAQTAIRLAQMNAQMAMLYDVSAPKKPRLSRGYPEHAVGMENAVQKVLQLLEWESDQKAVAVILHAFGGMGKTTLGDAVFSKADFEGCKYSEIRLFENIGSIPNIMELQKCILKDLTGPEETIPDIRTYESGQRELGKILKNVPAFIYIDNVLGENELMQLLPKDFDTSKKVRLLLTARDSNVGRACPRNTSFKMHSMENISEEDATRFLKREVLDAIEGKLKSTQIHDIIEVCGGVPLMLTLVAKVLRYADDKQTAYNMVMQDKQNVKGLTYNGKEEYFFAYDSLPEKCRDPFLDVCSFFKGMEWNKLADIVGEFELDTLQKRSLVNKDIHGHAFVHDVILTIGHQKAEGTRLKFSSAIQLEQFVKDNQGMTGIKGIWLSENNRDRLTLSASTLDSMCKSLRVLGLGSLIEVEGQCNKVFENLLFFQGEITHLPFHRMSQLKELRCLAYEPEDLTLPKMPPSLRIMQFDGKLSSPAFQISSTCLQQLKNLRILKLINFDELKKLPEDIGDQVKDLQELNLLNCKSLKELPRSVSKLQSLRHLALNYCSSLTELPQDFGSLKSLQSLQLQGCLSLRQLGEDFGSLNSLQLLNLDGCTGLKALPNNFEKLSSLRELGLSSCENLEDLPHGLGSLSSLVTLSGFPNCHKLRSVPDTIGQLKLTGSKMDMSNCSSLTELPDGFCNFLWIIRLQMLWCKSLERLPNRFGELTNLKWLLLAGCSSLHSLPEGFGELTNLRMLVLGGCSSLHSLPEGFGQLKYLELLDLSGCKSLEELCNDFHCLKSLGTLSLIMCESLKKLPEDFHCLISLRFLVLQSCAVLEGKSMDSLIKIKTLQTLEIVGSGMVLDRWAEIQRESDQPWPFTVFTEQDISTEEKEDKEKNMLSQLQFLLSEGREKPFHLSHPHLLLVLDSSTEFNQNFPWLLIEETIDDIQIDFEMVYLGSHFDKLPPKAKNIIAGHVDDLLKDNVFNLIFQMAGTLDVWDGGRLNIIQMSMLEDGGGVQCRPCWKLLTFLETEEFLLCRCGKYLQLKQLVETSPESPVNLLTELFATGEDQICTFQKAPTGNSKPLTCKADELKGKTIVLEMRPLDVCYDVRLESLSQLYNTRKNTFNLEIISIPLAHRSSHRRLDAVEQFSRGIPWLVFQNPWAIPSAVIYFLIKMLSPDEVEKWSSSRIKIIEPDGRIFTASKPVLSLLDTWGAKAYPFSVQKIKELKEEEMNQMETMSTVEFLFKHLESVWPHQVKEMMLPSKVVCLYGGIRSENMMKEFMYSIQNAFMNVRDSIHFIYFPSIILKDVESIPITDNLVIPHRKISPFPQPHPEMEGMLLLNLSVHDSFRFWRRLYFMRDEMPEMYKRDTDHLNVMKKLIKCFDNVNPWIILIDEEGKMITEKGREIVLACTSSMEDKAKGWTELLIKGSKEQRKQALLEFRRAKKTSIA